MYNRDLVTFLKFNLNSFDLIVYPKITDKKQILFQHSFRKFLGYCNDFDREMRKCLKGERLRRQKSNLDQAKARQADIRARILANEKNTETVI